MKADTDMVKDGRVMVDLVAKWRSDVTMINSTSFKTEGLSQDLRETNYRWYVVIYMTMCFIMEASVESVNLFVAPVDCR